MTRVGPAGAFVRTAAGPAPAVGSYETVGRELTDREVEVLTAYARCGIVKVVAAELGISLHTAKGHLNNAYRKLGVNNSRDAFRRLGWLQVPV